LLERQALGRVVGEPPGNLVAVDRLVGAGDDREHDQPRRADAQVAFELVRHARSHGW
jgi:hypothetical protein